MSQYFCLKKIRLIFTLSFIFMINVFLFNNSFVFATSEINISEKLSQIPDELLRSLHSQQKFVNFADLPENFRQLNNGIEELLQWQQIAAFSYALIDSVTVDTQDPFDLSEENKSQYGIILTKDSNILIVFKGSARKEESDFLKDLSPSDSIRLYDVYPENSNMSYIRHFFDIPDGYSYENNSILYKLTIGLINPTDWSMSFSAIKVDKSFLYAALSCQIEVFTLLDRYMSTSFFLQYNILLTGQVIGAGVSSLFSCLLHQKLKEEGKLGEDDYFQEMETGLLIYLHNFETPPVFNGIARDIFYEKIGEKRIKTILSPEDQAIADSIGKAIKKAMLKG